jgi:outer membrane protein W
MTRRILFVLLVLAAPVSLFAQNDVGLWLNTSTYQSTTFNDIEGGNAKIKFDSKLGYGVSFNHFSGPNMSTEFAWHQLRSDAKGDFTFGNIHESAKLGDFKVNQLSALIKWHFIPRSFIVPYVGAGAAYFTGGRLETVNDPSIGETGETIDMGNKFGLLLNAGVNFAVMRNLSIGLDLRRAQYKAREKGGTVNDEVKLDPTTISLGVRFRM